MEDRTLLSTFLVSNANDSGLGSLRQAILDSNNATGATNTIDFHIADGGVQTILPLSSLPAITGSVFIDGFSEPGYVNTPLIEINGSQADGGDGLTITGPGVIVRGVDVDNFTLGAGIHLTGAGATGDWIYGDFLGIDPTGMKTAADKFGVEIDGGASNDLVGTNGDGVNDAAERNVVSANLFAGVLINGFGTDSNVVAGNLIGTSVTGDIALGNDNEEYAEGGGGVVIQGGASGNRIGTDGASVDDAGERNMISGNFTNGIVISGSGTSGDIVAGNYIGAVTGTGLPYNGRGVLITDGASFDWIGVNPDGSTAVGDEGNVISGNKYQGIQILGASDDVVAGNQIVNNSFVTNSYSYTADLPNVGSGAIDIEQGSRNNTIGGTSAASGNLITQNGGPGIDVMDTSTGNQITANRIFGNSGQAIDLLDDGVTYNSSVPRQGPNNLQNFPIIVTDAGGQLEGWLGGSLPNTSYLIDFYANSAYNSDGSGEADEYLGSRNVTTDASGEVVFTIPFTAPPNLPIITTTATDPQGNTSEVSALRRATLVTPSSSLRAVPNQALVFSSAAGQGFAIEDPDAGPLNPVWNVTLAVDAGTLTLSSTAGLIVAGDGTGSLSYSGPLSAINAALDGLTYIPPASSDDFTTLVLSARSNGVSPLETQFGITNGVLMVDTTADAGPSSFRQAILDANSLPDIPFTIDFDISGAGVHTIEPVTPLPPITGNVIIDGTTQPGFAGTPLIAIGDESPGGVGSLTVSGGDVAVRGLGINGVAIDATAAESLIAVLAAQGGTSRLSLLDSQGQTLVDSDGLSTSDPDDVISQQLPSGSYFLTFETTGAAGDYTLSISMTPTTGAFASLPVGSDPNAIVAGDFSGDGNLDLAVANESGDTVSILMGNGNGTFQPQVTYQVGRGPIAIVAGDFTGNGDLDLAVVNEGSDDVSILLGRGDGTFQPQVPYMVGADPDAIVAGTFIGDSPIDLAVANRHDSTVSILIGNGDGTFQPQVLYAVGSGPDAIVAGDFSGNGQLDLAVANEEENTVSILMGNGNGTLRSEGSYTVGLGPDAIAAGDFTGDGRIDLAVANRVDGTVSVLLGNGNGTFQGEVPYAVGSSPGAIVAGDFSGDGVIDLACGNGNAVAVLMGRGNGTFQPEVSYTVGFGLSVTAIVAGDWSDDGRIDLAIANENEGFVGGISILLGNGSGFFQPQSATSNVVGTEPTAIVAGDFTGDGRIDLAVANGAANTVSILIGNGDGTFQPQVTYAVGADPDAIVAGDFNGDGRIDLAVANAADNTVSILLGNGDGTFQSLAAFAAGPDPTAIAAGNFDSDGPIDLAVANGGEGSTVSILMGRGDGTFRSPVAYAVGPDPDAILADDFSGDGQVDLAVANGEGSTVSILMNNGNGTFRAHGTYAVGSGPDAIAAGYFTGDGWLDLAVANELDGTVSVLLGNGNGMFQRQVTSAVGPDPTAIVAGDFSSNGIFDLAVVNPTGVSILTSNGDGIFVQQHQYQVELPGAIVVGDFNGRTDLAIINTQDDDVSVLLGNDDGTFAAAGQIATTRQATPLVADLNGDGTDDVLVVDGAGEILYRQGIPGQPGAFEPPVTVNPPLPDGANPYTSRDIALVTTDGAPIIASVDAQDNAISLYAWRAGAFHRIGSLTTGQLPAQIIAADVNGDGLDDLVVRNAGDGTLSVFFAKTFIGPINPQVDTQSFLPAVTLGVGVGVSDVEAVDTTGDGRLDLVVTNQATGQVSVLLNLGNDTFAPTELYRAGTGLSAVDPGGSPEVTSLDATAGLAAGALTPGGLTDLVTINPGSDTLDVLVGLGAGRFANSPVPIQTEGPAQVVRTGDFTGNGLDDLAVLTADAVSIYLANGQGGFLKPTTYAVPSESEGLTVTDLLGNGKLDLLVGDAYGDVLVLLGNDNGTFAPYHEANQAVELAVADLTGNGSKDIIYADQGLDRVVVDYGASEPTVLADQATGLLEPGAVALADLNDNGIPDLIVANSGSNNVLVYPGLGNGQFGPAINDGNGYFVGTNPVGITVAKLTGSLPDLVVADEGSNQVSILLNQSQMGGAISFSAGPRLNSGGSGPVSTVVGNFTGGTYPDLVVTNSQSNDVAVLPGVGQGFFNDTDPRTYAVGTDPGSTFVGSFNGQSDLVTVNAGSNDLTLVSGFETPASTTSTITSGGVDPDTAFAFESASGFEDLVVGNAGDGELDLFEGGADGLGLTAAVSKPNLPDPTALAFSALTGGELQFYAATAGSESAELVGMSLGLETSTGSPFAAAGPLNAAAQLVPLQESSLPLVATVLTLTMTVSEEDPDGAAFLPGTGVSLGQGLSFAWRGGSAGDDDARPVDTDTEFAATVPATLAPWERFVLGLNQAVEQFLRENPDGVSGAPAGDSVRDRSESPPAMSIGTPNRLKSLIRTPDPVPDRAKPDPKKSANKCLEAEAIDAIIQIFWRDDEGRDRRTRLSGKGAPYGNPPGLPTLDSPLIALSHPVFSLDWVGGEPRGSARSELPPVSPDGWNDRLRPPEPMTIKKEPYLPLTSLVVAMMATEWAQAWRWHGNVRTGSLAKLGNSVRGRRILKKEPRAESRGLILSPREKMQAPRLIRDNLAAKLAIPIECRYNAALAKP